MTMKATLKIVFILMGYAILANGCSNSKLARKNQTPLNILFVGVDDLRPELRSYGFDHMHTPNIDRLAAMGIQFDRAYVQQAVCAASRASFLTGCRPITTGVNYPYTKWFNTTFREEFPTIPVVFTQQGYYVRTLGKIHHGPADRGMSESHFTDSAYLFPDRPEVMSNWNKLEERNNIEPWGHPDLPDHMFSDGQIADECIATIHRALQGDKPFFIAPGFHKPHLPYVCPKKYYDLYNRDAIELSVHPQLDETQHEITAMPYGAHNWNNYINTGIDEETARSLKHHYLACISFIDAQVGKILDELEALDLMDNTIIVFWSDHGYHLGDHGIWTKQTNYELSTRSPLIIYDPRIKLGGKRSAALVEYVDLYPTLLDMCNIPLPDWIEGTSMVPLLNAPDKVWKRAAFSQFPRNGGEYEGYSVRTKNFRYTEWRNELEGGEVFHKELYDHRVDSVEILNLADDERYYDIVLQHAQILADGWKAALPPGVTNNSDNPPGYDPKMESILDKRRRPIDPIDDSLLIKIPKK
jgi:iduronate 2-sulfatase